MNFMQYITMVLLSLNPSYADEESWENRTGRMEIVAKAIDDASAHATCEGAYAGAGCEKKWLGNKKELALLLVTTGFWESRFAKNVHEGKCRKYECDAYKVANKVYHRARSPWQIQKTGLVSNEEYDQMTSATYESTKVSANVAVRYLAVGMTKCKTIKGAISSYAGAGCDWKGAKPRLAFFNSLLKVSDTDLQSKAVKEREKLEKRLSRKTAMR